jgi:imidazolonepropionase-like amidohydrolase
VSFFSLLTTPVSQAAQGGPVSEKPIVFVNVNVIPMDTERVLQNQTVIVEDHRIRVLGPSSEVAVPKRALRIAGEGKYLMPGLIDSYAHVDGIVSLPLFLANGVTTVRNTAGGHPMHLAIRDRVERGELVGPMILTTGGDITGSPPNWDSMEPVTTPEQAARVVAEEKRLGFDGIMIYSKISPDVHKAVIESANKLGLPVTGHAPLSIKFAESVKSGQKSFENLIGFVRLATGELGFPIETAENYARMMRDAGVVCIPTLTVHRVRSGRELLRPEQRQYVAPSARIPLDPAHEHRLGPQRNYRYEGAPALVSILHKTGVRVLLGTDAGYPGVAAGFSVHGPFGELQNLVEAGFKPFEALAAGTRQAAEFLGRAEQIGTVSAGKRADLVLLDANPLKDVTNASRIAGVVARGRWMPKSELQSMLHKLALSYARHTDRFAGMPPLPRQGASEFKGKYELRQNGVTIGEERIAIDRIGPDRRVLTSEASVDPYHDTKTLLKIELGKSAHGVRVEVDRRAAEGNTRLVMERTGTEVHVFGSHPIYGNIDLREQAEASVFLGGPMLADYLTTDLMANFALVSRALPALQVGQSAKVQLKQIELNPGEYFRNAIVGDMDWTITRREDAASEQHAGCIGCRTHEIDLPGRAGFGSYKLELVLDSDGYPWRVTGENGERVFQRVHPVRKTG